MQKIKLELFIITDLLYLMTIYTARFSKIHLFHLPTFHAHATTVLNCFIFMKYCNQNKKPLRILKRVPLNFLFLNNSKICEFNDVPIILLYQLCDKIYIQLLTILIWNKHCYFSVLLYKTELITKNNVFSHTYLTNWQRNVANVFIFMKTWKLPIK